MNVINLIFYPSIEIHPRIIEAPFHWKLHLSFISHFQYLCLVITLFLIVTIYLENPKLNHHDSLINIMISLNCTSCNLTL